MAMLLENARYTLRQLRKAPGFTAAVVLTLALGIGLNAAIFTMVDCIFVRPLGYHDADRIVALKTQFTKEGRAIFSLGGGDYQDIAQQTRLLEKAAYFSGPFDAGVQLEGHAAYTGVTEASPQFLALMGAEPVAGRMFAADGAGRDVVVSGGFAREMFGAAASAVGRTLTYDGKPRTIVGVAPDGFSYPGKTSVWVEVPETPANLNRTAYNQRGVGKLRAGVTLEQLSAELGTIGNRLSQQYPDDRDKGLTAIALQEQLVGKVRPLFRMLMGSVLVVLLIVVANVTHLQLVRSTRQRREVAIRTALGASRSDVAVRALLEAVWLAVGGCLLGVALGVLALRMIVRFAPADLPRLTDVQLNGHVVAFSFLLSMTVMALTALLPVVRSWRVDPVTTLKQDAARGTEGRASARLRNGLVVAEVAMTLMLSVAAVLLVKQLLDQSKAALGFDAERIAMLEFHAADGEKRSAQEKLARLDSAMQALASVPGVSSVAAVRGVPMSGMISDVSYGVRGIHQYGPGLKMPSANIAPVSPGYFATMGIPVLRGRGFEETDSAGNELVVLISQAAVKQFAGQDPMGRLMTFGLDSHGTWYRVVGIVGDVRQDSPGSAPEPTLYVPLAQHPGVASDLDFVMRSSMAPEAVLRAAQARLEGMDASVAMRGLTMRESIGESERAQRFRTLLFASFAGLSLLLAALGMYSVTAYTVAQRRYEFALRLAMGATRGLVLRRVLLQGATVAAAGVVVGIAFSVALWKLSVTLVGDVGGVSAAAYVMAAVGVLLIAIVAVLGPAWRASAVEPMEALRNE